MGLCGSSPRLPDDSKPPVALFLLPSEIKEKLARLVRTRERDRATLKHQVHSLDSYVFKPPCTLIMRDFEEHREDKDEWFSEPFYTHSQGYKMCISVFANGFAEGEDTHVSVLAHMMRGEFDSLMRWPFRGKITIELENHLDGEGLRKEIHFTSKTPPEFSRRVTNGDKNKGWGCTQFIALSQLKDTSWFSSNDEYLKNNSLHFRVTNVDVFQS